MKCVLKDTLDHNNKVKTKSTHLQVSCGLLVLICSNLFKFFLEGPPPPLCFLSLRSNIILLSPRPPILSCHNNFNFSIYFICNRNTDLHGIFVEPKRFPKPPPLNTP